MSDAARKHLDHAARLAMRGHGGAEPNPMVGCVMTNADGVVIGSGFHRRCGGPHAEIDALRSVRSGVRGATVYVTLEPCNHTGRTPPCSEALVEAGVARVVFGRRDTTPHGAGGAERLRAAGIDAVCIEHAPSQMLAAPFFHRLETGLPWVIAKWAQTIDGRIATRTGASQWISGAASRRLVHRERGRVDAMLTGIGTVLADDPLLTARCRRPRRSPRRVVIDPKLQTPLDARLVRTAHEIPVTIATHASVLDAAPEHVTRMRDAGVDLVPIPMDGDDLPLAPVLRHLSSEHDVATVMVEAGAGLLGRLFAQGLVNEALVFVGPILLGDDQATPAARGRTARELTDGIRMTLVDVRRRDDDVVMRYRC